MQVITHKGEKRISESEIAASLGQKRKVLKNMLRKYSDKLEGFGVLHFESAKVNRTGRPIKEHYLNEDQALFIGTLASNTDQVVTFKQKLITAFSAATKGYSNTLSTLPTNKELAYMVIKAEEDKEMLQQEIAQKQEQLDYQHKLISDITADVPVKTLRANINSIIRRNGRGGLYQTRWRHLYKEFKYRYSIDLELRATNAGISNLDYAEQYGYLRPLCELALQIFVRDPQLIS